ncbi:MAG TPA: DUF4215 domain-containing protein [Candidatus Binatia bacterium]|jgi:cysteine-rich repeat protein|nr:DUF4215 domain-containing protein [Candidatus Binatia bacterium]
MRSRLLLAVAALLFAVSAHAQTPDALTGGKRLRLVDPPDPSRAQAKVTFAKGAGLETIDDPTCPSSASGAFVRFSTSAETGGSLNLPCSNWSRSGSGYRYRDRSGATAVTSARLQPGKLVVMAKGPGYAPALGGPVTHVEVRFTVGDRYLCGRFGAFTRNDTDLVVSKGPTTACQVVCGDGIHEGIEACDDGNTIDGDGCPGDCTGPGICGNGVRNTGETCDDGNLTSGDGCDANCTPTGCGNGIATTGEQCDDANAAIGDGCRPNCTAEICGDTILDPQEQCDDGNTEPGDCCSATCVFENGSACTDGDNCTEGDVCIDGTCVGDLIAPWVNEFDYDDFSSTGVQDRDEFVEIAGPAGLDLSGYKILAIEGNSTCLTGTLGVANGNANVTTTVPGGTVLGDDTGTGIGFLTACFANTSTNHVTAGDCDLVLPAPDANSNLANGDLLNLGTSCPDGILVLDAGGQLVDAISYEGQVPNTGTYGPRFHVTPYNAGQDQGMKTGVSFEKTSSTLARATAASEWRLSGACVDASLTDSACTENSDTAGVQNPGQDLHCSDLFCGDGVVSDGEDCDAGAANSDGPDAPCRPDCTYRQCGDGILDTAAGEQCETSTTCSGGRTCFACECVTGSLLGSHSFTVVPGPSDSNPTDDGQATLLRVTDTFGISNGSAGDFNPGPLTIAAGAPDANGVAALILTAPVTLSATLPASAGRFCIRIRQDPDAIGRIDCNGGSNFNVAMALASNGTGANGTPMLTVGGAGNSGAGAGALRLLIQPGIASNAALPCSSATYGPVVRTALTTATATASITNTRQGGDTTVTQAGQPFNCASFATFNGASLALPNTNPDVVLPLGLGTRDIAQVLRLNDE